jgi:hypothetical protein
MVGFGRVGHRATFSGVGISSIEHFVIIMIAYNGHDQALYSHSAILIIFSYIVCKSIWGDTLLVYSIREWKEELGIRQSWIILYWNKFILLAKTVGKRDSGEKNSPSKNSRLEKRIEGLF